MPEAQYNAWCMLKTYLNSKYGQMAVYGHREKGSSECPGKFFPLSKVKDSNSIGVTNTPTPSTNNSGLMIQQVMNRLKIRDGKGNALDEDGIIGNCTKEAVKRFQSICNLTVDGVSGPQTLNAINIILSKPTLEVGSLGIAVRYIQARVGTPHDGDFGWNTNRYVAIWQGQNGCTQDGVVGPQTWTKMIG
jgi:peptidoglycan hydrolase-like protein with peptidoglycan-binding domain